VKKFPGRRSFLACWFFSLDFWSPKRSTVSRPTHGVFPGVLPQPLAHEELAPLPGVLAYSKVHLYSFGAPSLLDTESVFEWGVVSLPLCFGHPLHTIGLFSATFALTSPARSPLFLLPKLGLTFPHGIAPPYGFPSSPSPELAGGATPSLPPNTDAFFMF